MNNPGYYKLQIYLDPNIIDTETRELYETKILEQQQIVNKHLKLWNEWDISMTKDIWPHIDAGFDLFTPNDNILAPRVMGQKVNMGIKCAMTFDGMPVAYYLYPRSSTGAKTPLRLSNSVGIIDSGYRGYIIALFDNISSENPDKDSEAWDYIVYKHDRLVQICAPNISYPIYPELVDSIAELGTTSRGEGGFGSTGI